MKFIKTIIVAVLSMAMMILLSAFLSVNAYAEIEYTPGSSFEFDPSSGLITRFIGDETVVNIPPYIDGVEVTGISGAFNGDYYDMWTNNCSYITSITIPYTVRDIDTVYGNPFKNCTSLEEINVDESNENYYSIDGILYKKYTDMNYNYIAAYPQAKQNETLILPENLQGILEYAFYNVNNLKEILISSPDVEYSYFYVYSNAFYSCYYLETITIPGYDNYVEDNAVVNCYVNKVYCIRHSAADNISIYTEFLDYDIKFIYYNEPGDEYIYSFDEATGTIGVYCGNIEDTDIVVPDEINGVKVTAIGDNAFSNSYLNSIVLPDSIVSIGNNAFSCASISNIEIKDGVTSIGEYAFEGCINLTEFTIPGSVTYIGAGAFRSCENLGYISLPAGLDRIEDYLFSDCINLYEVNIPKEITYIGSNAFENCSSLSYVNIPDGVTYIGDSVFIGCNSLYSIELPDSVTYMGDLNISGLENLQSVKFSAGIQDIKPYALSNCSSLYNVTIPYGITFIGDNAFENCCSLTNVEIPSSVKYIGNSAFQGCSSLVKMEILAGVTSIGNNAFEGCVFINSLRIPDSVTYIGEYAFKNCALCDVKLSNGLTKVNEGMFYNCCFNGDIDLSEGIAEIGEYAFYNCSGNSISFPSGIENMADNAFENSSFLKICCARGTAADDGFKFEGLEFCYYSDEVAEAKEDWFEIDPSTGIITRYFSNIRNVKVPSEIKGVKVTGLNEYVLGMSPYIVQVILPEGITCLPASLFTENMNMTSVTLPEGLKTIESAAFRNCYSLKELIIPKSIEYIDSTAFYYWDPEDGIGIQYDDPGISDLYCYRDTAADDKSLYADKTIIHYIGDVNSDNNIDNTDSALIMKKAISLIEDDVSSIIYDYNRDGEVDLTDAIAVLKDI